MAPFLVAFGFYFFYKEPDVITIIPLGGIRARARTHSAGYNLLALLLATAAAYLCCTSTSSAIAT